MTLDELKKQCVNSNVYSTEITANAKSILQVLTDFEQYIKEHAVPGATGSPGVSITSVDIENQGSNVYALKVNLSDDTVQTAGTFTSAPGAKGDPGVTPAISAGAVSVPSSQPASVTVTGTTEAPIFNFAIPKGERGEPGSVEDITIDQPASATSGTLTATQLSTLQASKLNGIIFNNERYILQDNQHESGFLVYSHVGHDSTNNFFVKCITITISTLAWVLSSTAVKSSNLYQHKIKISDFMQGKLNQSEELNIFIINNKSEAYNLGNFITEFDNVNLPAFGKFKITTNSTDVAYITAVRGTLAAIVGTVTIINVTQGTIEQDNFTSLTDTVTKL